MDTEAQAFDVVDDVLGGATQERALQEEAEALRREVARLSDRPSAGSLVMAALAKACPWMWHEITGSALDPSKDPDPERMARMLSAILARAAGGPPMEAETWHIVSLDGKHRERRHLVDVRTRTARESRSIGRYVASLRRSDVFPLQCQRPIEIGDDPRVLCALLAASAMLPVLRILSPAQILEQGVADDATA